MLFVAIGANAQTPKFTATVSKTTVALNSKFKVEFKLENAKGSNFEAPEFKDFEIVGGPSTSSSMSVINGVVTQSISYVYYLKPKEVGDFTVKAAKVSVDGKDLKTDKVRIKVVEESDEQENEKEDMQSNDPFKDFFYRQMPTPQQQKPQKKPRKTYQI